MGELPRHWATYPDCLSFLDRLGNEVRGARYDLETAARVIPAICPGRFAPAVVVAGTNGKGSVVWWLAEVLRATGRRVLRYTSPHLTHPRERIDLDGHPLPEADFLAAARCVLSAVRELAPELPRRPTYYEWLTFIAAAAAHRTRPDLHVLEVGMGGRLDAVNVADPVLAVITTVDLDHQAVLGDTRAAIAREKMGILRPTAPVVIGPQDDWAVGDPADRLEQRSARVVRARAVYETAFTPAERAAGQSQDWNLGLAGGFQLYNAATVMAAVTELTRLGWPVGADALRHGLAQGGWPGRLERFEADPEVILDGAHNPQAVAEAVHELRRRGHQPVAVFGAMADKDIPAMLAELRPACRALILTRPPGDRAAGPEAYGPWLGGEGVHWRAEPETALTAARELARQTGSTDPVYVLGSLHLVARLRSGLTPARPR